MFDLFILESCPYCQRVMAYLKENNISFHKFDISNRDNVQKLLKLGGMEQVPFLYDEENDVRMYESDDIIAYLNSFKKV
ncbi:MAG: glutathione S-transferase N-terminal domain-containing protein [Muribaculaceae bacterium]|nr:glutathione S-transferase N-terminal domain-containing protein [Muribaculaceae bacterium]